MLCEDYGGVQQQGTDIGASCWVVVSIGIEGGESGKARGNAKLSRQVYGGEGSIGEGREEWKGEKKRLGTWRVMCLDSVEKFKAKVVDLEADYDELKEKHEGLEVELENLKGCIIQEHINGF